jgi:hypothetical protein
MGSNDAVMAEISCSAVEINLVEVNEDVNGKGDCGALTSEMGVNGIRRDPFESSFEMGFNF